MERVNKVYQVMEELGISIEYGGAGGLFEWIDYKKVEPESALNSERMYSEEEVHKIIKSYKNNLPKLYPKLFYTNWFQQFKK
jgi:hypothetical protein